MKTKMKTFSFQINRETTSYVYAPEFISLPQDVDHNVDMTLNERPNIDHGDDTEASETSPFNDILSLSLSPLVSSNEIGFLAAPRSVRMSRCESEHTTSSVGSNQFSCDSGGARSEGTNPTQMDYYQQPQMSDVQIQLRLLKQKQDRLDQQRLFLDQQRQALLDQQRLFLDPSQSFPRCLAPSQTLDMLPQAISTSLPQAHLNLIPQQISGTNSQQNLISFSHPFQQSDFPGHVSHTPTSNQLATVRTGAWVPAPPPSQFQRMRAYTKVYKTGSVGRSIDITRYSGYEELKQDLARIFDIEGQLEDRHRVGWKLVFVDHEHDLLVGDYPWEEFVNCVWYIKILSPQEVQAMSLNGDFWNSLLPNLACSTNLQLPAAC